MENDACNYLKDYGFYAFVGIVCGTGLGGICDRIQNQIVIPYSDIPGFEKTTAPGHEGVLIFGRLNKIPVVCLSGRLHLYEGYNINQICFPIKVLLLLEIKILILTNSSGALNNEYKIGDVMVIEDHVAFPLLSGCSLDHAYEGNVYDAFLSRQALRMGQNLGMNMHYGIYGYVCGPQYQTPAEGRFLKQIGIDAVGMSTAPEALVASSIRVLGLSLITTIEDTKRKTNCKYQDPEDYIEPIHHVTSVAEYHAENLFLLIEKFVVGIKYLF